MKKPLFLLVLLGGIALVRAMDKVPFYTPETAFYGEGAGFEIISRHKDYTGKKGGVSKFELLGHDASGRQLHSKGMIRGIGVSLCLDEVKEALKNRGQYLYGECGALAQLCKENEQVDAFVTERYKAGNCVCDTVQYDLVARALFQRFVESTEEQK